MRIAICVNGRAHEGGVTSFINSIVDGLRELGATVDVITIFGVSRYREVRKDFVKKTDKFLENSNVRTLFLYIFSKFILLIRFTLSFLRHRYDFVFAIDMSAVNALYPIAKIFRIPILLIDSAT